MSQYHREEETFKIIGICMEVHRSLGVGLLEVIYKDALEIEFNQNNIPFEREKEFLIEYKGKVPFSIAGRKIKIEIAGNRYES